jgi:hypothetical protein
MACRLGVLAAAGLIAGHHDPAQANPATTVADCLRPSASVSAASSPVLVPPGAVHPQLLAQALPSSTGVRVRTPASAQPSLDSNPRLAQAAVPESLPACTYDPPLAPASPVIRGLW